VPMVQPRRAPLTNKSINVGLGPFVCTFAIIPFLPSFSQT
jgi:hypothetical protein